MSFPRTLFHEHLEPGPMPDNLKERILVIDPKLLPPAQRTTEHQLVLALSGKGLADPNPGAKIKAKSIEGQDTVLTRSSIIGVAPDWIIEAAWPNLKTPH